MRTAAALAGLALLLAGCSGDPAAGPGRSTAPSAPGPSAVGPSAPAGERVRATLDGVELALEVADDPQERAVGLMGRTSVPAGTGMVFRYDALSEGRFYMYRVPIPLRATFIREGRVVSTVVMPPCGLDDPAACPTYGADGPFDTVVETAPDQLPDPSPGDRFDLRD